MTQLRVAFLAFAGADGWIVNCPLRGAARGRRPPERMLVLPGADVLARQVDAAGSTPAQARAAALAALASELASPAADCVAALGPVREGKRMAWVIDRAKLASHVAAAQARGFDPDIVTVDLALVGQPEAAGGWRCARLGEDWLAVSAARAFACQDDLLDTLIPALSRETVNLDALLAAGWSQDQAAALPDFRPLAPRKTDQADLRRTLVVSGGALAAALVLACAAPWVSGLRQDAGASTLRAEAARIARTALPEAPRIVNARAQLETALLPWRGGERMLAISRDFLSAAADTPALELTDLQAVPPGDVRAVVRVGSPDDLTPLRERLAQSGLAMQETAGPASGGRVQFELVVKGS